MLRLATIAAASALMTAATGLSADKFDEDAAYAAWKEHYLACIPFSGGQNATCDENYRLGEELQRHGWCWVAYDQDMMRPGSSRYLNEYLGVATCPAPGLE